MTNNKIVLIEDKPAIYGSFPYTVGNEYDYIFLEDISKISLNPIEVKGFLKNNINIDTIQIDYSISHNNENAIISLKNNENSKYEIPIQEFVDLFFISVYSDISLEEDNRIKNIKKELLDNDILSLLDENTLIYNKKYQITGKMIDKNNNIIGIINSFNVNEIDGSLSLQLNDVVTYLSSKNLNIDKIKFFTGAICVTINSLQIIKTTGNLLKTIECKVLEYNISSSDEPIIVDYSQTIEDEEQFFDEREKLLTGRQQILNNVINTNNSINRYFDDFDF